MTRLRFSTSVRSPITSEGDNGLTATAEAEAELEDLEATVGGSLLDAGSVEDVYAEVDGVG